MRSCEVQSAQNPVYKVRERRKEGLTRQGQKYRIQNPESASGLGAHWRGGEVQNRRVQIAPGGGRCGGEVQNPEFRVGNPLEGAQVKECKGSEMSN